MAFDLFKKTKAAPKRKPAAKKAVAPETSTETVSAPVQHAATPMSVILHTYVSEKATRLENFNQYVFKVTRFANKPEVKKAIQNRYKVKVVSVHMVNLPSKTRQVGRHMGTKQGFRKAIVTLAKGDSINSAKA
jgi:large subunit ribosomal protein L23